MKTNVVLVFCMIFLAGFVSANEVDIPQFPILPGYGSSSVVLNYVYEGGVYSNVVLTGENLRPNSEYMLVLIGRPSCSYNPFDDFANELVGLAGSWTCVDCDCSVSCSRTDEQYFVNKLKPDSDPTKECIQGYLTLDYFISDGSGNVFKAFDSEGNAHFLWCHNDFCMVDFLDSDSYDVVFRIKEESGGGFVPPLSAFTFFRSGSSGGSGGSGNGGSSGYGTQDVIPEFSYTSVIIALSFSALAFFLLRRR